MCAEAKFNFQAIKDIAESSEMRLLVNALGPDSNIHIVGGILRDVLMGRELGDLDLASPLHPSECLRRLELAGIHCIPTGLQHQTVTAVLGESFGNVEITSFRAPGMNPSGGVFLSETIEEDLSYRDFTINALAWNISESKLIDPFAGLNDIKEGLLKTVGLPRERFLEDPLRAMRLIRFHSVLGFEIEQETLEASKEFADSLGRLSIERVRDEFSKTLLGCHTSSALSLLLSLGFLEKFMPELVTCADFEQNSFHSKDVFNHTLEVLQKTRKNLVLRLAALLHDIGKPPSLSVDDSGQRHFYKHERIGAEMSREILSRLKYPNKVVDQVCVLVDTHMRPITAGPPGLRRLLRDTEEVFSLWRELKEADASSVKIDPNVLFRQLEEFDFQIEAIQKQPDVSPLKNLAISGKDLIDLGAVPGPKFGDTLRLLHERVLDDPSLNDKETLLNMVRDESLLDLVGK
jgi:putative nucleotidyltransferase with HDIG domain